MDSYESIFKRRSFHLFGTTIPMTTDELCELKDFIASASPLDAEIRTKTVIVPAGETTTHCGAEYCILFYSENKGDHLRNIGYIGEQIDLWCTANGFGTLWLGFGKPRERRMDGLDFVIMMAVSKVDQKRFRKDMFKAKRRPLEENWEGERPGAAEIARFAPSACNSQPWYCVNDDGRITVWRITPEHRGLMSLKAAAYFNRIDIGIYLYFLEVCLEHDGLAFDRTLFPDPASETAEKVPAAEYRLRENGAD